MSVAFFIKNYYGANIRVIEQQLKSVLDESERKLMDRGILVKYKNSYIAPLKKGWYSVAGPDILNLMKELMAIKNISYSTDSLYIRASYRTLSDMGFEELTSGTLKMNEVLIHNCGKGVWIVSHTKADEFIDLIKELTVEAV